MYKVTVSATFALYSKNIFLLKSLTNKVAIAPQARRISVGSTPAIWSVIPSINGLNIPNTLIPMTCLNADNTTAKQGMSNIQVNIERGNHV